MCHSPKAKYGNILGQEDHNGTLCLLPRAMFRDFVKGSLKITLHRQ